jgi:multiple sugar transport system permease protein
MTLKQHEEGTGLLGYIEKQKVYKNTLTVVMFIFSALMLLPFILMLSTSLKTEAELLEPVFRIIPKHFAFANYITAMQRGDWPLYFWNSFLITFVSVIGSLVINSTAGYAFARLKFKGRNFLFLAALIGMMVPQQVTMVPLFVILRKIPLVGGNDLFGEGGHGFINSYWGMILPQLAGAFGVFMFRQFFMNFPSSLDDAAKIDGLGRVRAFTQIYLPLSLPVFATLAALKTTMVWSEYTWPLIVTQSESLKTVQLALTMFKTESEVQWTLLMAATTVITLPLIALFLAAQKYFVEGIASTGMK